MTLPTRLLDPVRPDVRRRSRIVRSLRWLAVVSLACWVSSEAWAQTDPGDIAKRQAAGIARNLETLAILVDLAERTCISNHTRSESAGISLTLRSIIKSVTTSVEIEKQVRELRGASEQMTGAVAQLENDEIRKCMNEKLAPAFALVNSSFLATEDTGVAWPEPIEFRFNFVRSASKDQVKYSENLKVNLLRVSRSPISRRIANQFDSSGTPYYQLDISYPIQSEIIKGTITPEIKATSSLSTELPSTTPICLQRPTSFPSVKAEYDLFDCAEGALCKSSASATGWLATCPQSGEVAPPAGARPTRFSMFSPAWAQPSVERRWVVPSLETLTEQNSEGVGYTVFTLRTAAFQKQEALGVEVDVRVNGTRVEEDGLSPELRPVANDPSQPFTHSFALQSLDFRGLHGGCDEISVGLKPIYSSGKKGEPQQVRLSYAALRDVEERKVPFAGDVLVWRAAYITPSREWRYYPIVHSYIYSVDDPKQAEKSAGAAEADRRWFDEQRFVYNGQPVVGVVRPPRTIQQNRTAAFGLAAGLLQPTGQIRFTFPQPDAQRLADFLFQQRSRSETAGRVIEPDKYIFQAVGGYRTVKGVCGTG